MRAKLRRETSDEVFHLPPCIQTHLSPAVCSHQLNWHSQPLTDSKNMQHSNLTLGHFVITSALPLPLPSPPCPSFNLFLSMLTWKTPKTGVFPLLFPLVFSSFAIPAVHLSFPLSDKKMIFSQSPETAETEESSFNQHTTAERWVTAEQTKIRQLADGFSNTHSFLLHRKKEKERKGEKSKTKSCWSLTRQLSEESNLRNKHLDSTPNFIACLWMRMSCLLPTIYVCT